jgi:cold shock CspA family protein
MNENEQKSLEIYKKKFEAEPSLFNDFQAMDYIKLLKDEGNNEEAIEKGRIFFSDCPELDRYKNHFAYALYNIYVNIDNEAIKNNEEAFYNAIEEIASVCKQERYSPLEPALNRAIKYLLHTNKVNYHRLLWVLDFLDAAELSNNPFVNPEGKEFESKKERYYRLKIRALYETKNYVDCVICANHALSLNLKWHYNALQWIKYYRGCSLVEEGKYEEAEREFLALQNRIRGINFYEVLYRIYSNLEQDKRANTYLLYEFFESGFDVSLLSLYQRLLEATKKIGKEDLIEIVDIFISKLCKENNVAYETLKDYPEDHKYAALSADELYDGMYNVIMKNISLYVDRIQGTIVHYNQDKRFGTISTIDEEGIFFKQSDYVYDEEVQRRDVVEYTVLPTYDTKKGRITSKAVLLTTIEEYMHFGY